VQKKKKTKKVGPERMDGASTAKARTRPIRNFRRRSLS
jgi:hypothetical protein